jgi:hypothetical protein
MWSEYERAAFRLVVIGEELHLFELRPVERNEIPMHERCRNGHRQTMRSLTSLHENRVYSPKNF